jgi:hypothetical protein
MCNVVANVVNRPLAKGAFEPKASDFWLVIGSQKKVPKRLVGLFRIALSLRPLLATIG